ncbi:hypothetical protein BLOT_014633 [Blomia tropicalis]|nr:hypothetical protein BLOT_014633 [Blomia tropicalis]
MNRLATNEQQQQLHSLKQSFCFKMFPMFRVSNVDVIHLIENIVAEIKETQIEINDPSTLFLPSFDHHLR